MAPKGYMATKSYEDSSEISNGTPKGGQRAPLERIASSLVDASVLSDRICEITDRLIGTIPEATGMGEADDSIRNGIITSLAEEADDAVMRIRKAQRALDRLSSALNIG